MSEHDIIQLMGLDHPTTRVVTSEYFNPEHGLTERELIAHRQLKADQTILAAQITAAAALKIPLIYAVMRSEVPDVVKIGYSQHLTARLRKMPGSRLVAVQRSVDATWNVPSTNVSHVRVYGCHCQAEEPLSTSH